MNSERQFNSDIYWLRRHELHAGTPDATGYCGMPRKANSILYDLREQCLDKIIRGRDIQGCKVLDAGCGLGDFSHYYHKKGAIVYGCDISPLAIEKCASCNIGEYKVGKLSELPRIFPGEKFDIIHCFDVLYHIVDDDEWRNTLRAFCEMSSVNCSWFLTEIVHGRETSRHVRVRGREFYERELSKCNRMIAIERRLHLMVSISPILFARCYRLAPIVERLSNIWPFGYGVRTCLWQIK